MNLKARVGALAAATSLLAGGLAVVVETEANASEPYYSTCALLDSDHKGYLLRVYRASDDELVGMGEWNGDPWDWTPGDALRAWDEAKDGWGVVAVLDTGRRASTLGHNYPYHTDWITGNLTEGSRHSLRVEMWKGDSFWASDYCTVTA